MTAISTAKNPSYEVGTSPEPLGPQRRNLYARFNEFHEAQRLGDNVLMEHLKQIVPALLDEFERTEANSSDNPRWRRRTTRAGWHCAIGNYELAHEYELEGWEAANNADDSIDTDRVAKQKSISSSNIADELIRLDRYEESLQWARISCQLWNGNPVNHLVMAIALYHAGLQDHAEKVLRSLVDFVKCSGAGALQVAIYEDLLADVDVPAAADLIQAVYAS